jgi:hypothetical protein
MEKHMDKSKAATTEPYQWNGKNYDIALFENPDGVAVQAFLGDKPVSSCICIQIGSDEMIAIAAEVAKGDVENGKHEKHYTP